MLDESITLIIALFLLAFICHYNFIQIRAIFYFFFGLTINRINTKLPSSIKIGFLLMAIIILFSHEDIYLFSLLQVVWVSAIMIFLLGLGHFLEKTFLVTQFAYFGRNSVIVLLLHAMFINLLKPLSNSILYIDETGLLYSFIVLFITLYGCILTALFFDNVGASSYLFGIKSIYSRFKTNDTI